MQIPQETEAGDYRPGGWGLVGLGHGLVSCFWKRGEPRWLQGATEGLEQQRTDVR